MGRGRPQEPLALVIAVATRKLDTIDQIGDRLAAVVVATPGLE